VWNLKHPLDVSGLGVGPADLRRRNLRYSFRWPSDAT